MSFSSFAYGLTAAPSSPILLGPLRQLLASASEGGFISQIDDAALAPPAKYEVRVTNTGAVASDDVVLGFMVPPGAGKYGVPLQTLFGFERVHLAAGASTTVTLYPAHTDFSQVGRDGTRREHAGEYTVRFGMRETVAHGGGFVEHVVVAR